MAVMLFLAGPYTDFEALLSDMPEELEVASITYQNPAKILTNHLKFLKIFETFKPSCNGSNTCSLQNRDNRASVRHHSPVNIISPDGSCLEPFEAASYRAKQNIMDMELETVNSLLCGPCRCTLCCTGPPTDAQQEFFEIPLLHEEIHLFDLPVIDSSKSQENDPYSGNPLKIDNKPFYHTRPAIYNWKNGWSMILTAGSECPALSKDGTCIVYETRPLVCRKPQIFSAVLERKSTGEYALKNRLLAVWDCPYVRHLKDEITGYAALCETDLVLKKNKS
jgi:Fe-S-cluster containining protein